MRLFLCFFFTGFYVLAQNVDFEGSVIDFKTNDAIPYVNISFLNTLKGTSTTEEGKFHLEIPKDYLQKKIHVSSLGYKDTILMAQSLYKTKQLKMVAASFELEEVVVAKKLGASQILNPISSYSITSGFDSSSTPWVLALYFPNIGASKKYLKTITVFFRQKNEFTREKAKFRLRFYNVDSKSKMPNKDMVQKSIILESVRTYDYTSIDISSLKLQMPQNGVYIGLEWLFIPYNWYQKGEKNPITNKPIIEDRFAPTFGGMYTKNQNFKAMIYGMGEWQEFKVKSKDNNQNFIPAISLKIAKGK
ncbi:carboxypeptidase-like regulatory domain-containing protein [Croceitalea sp. MTPC9]|uniref:carboxypeptidase-like regulatory domain-containing protein n=1 Tax=unclassified Croceitalea TaxID=2632280 RepID=UPI002B3E0E02|nr:carboxypeptidase-like regulatory domain-containing protein [Croceitalea sp. MTPC6]GMN17922.1 carboxypeptidase-like regulatory domain-containing protein [Croceitalea sp. MTPC9]